MSDKPTAPSHRAYHVRKRKPEDKGRWIEIGAAWAHQDGKGFSLSLDLLPAAGGEITLRAIEAAEPDDRS